MGLNLFLAKGSSIEDLLLGAPSCSEACLFFSDDLLNLKFVTVSSFCLIHFDLCVDATWVVCHQLGLLGTDLCAVGCGGFVKTLNYFCQFFFLFC